jgi:hypothetical protein
MFVVFLGDRECLRSELFLGAFWEPTLLPLPHVFSVKMHFEKCSVERANGFPKEIQDQEALHTLPEARLVLNPPNTSNLRLKINVVD